MRIKAIRRTKLIGLAAGALLVASLLSECAESRSVAAKSGAQLWAENCQRCHNTPSPAAFSHEQWITIGMHMQTRAQLTEKERDKIVAFLSQ
jgi:hypothetical protein